MEWALNILKYFFVNSKQTDTICILDLFIHQNQALVYLLL